MVVEDFDPKAAEAKGIEYTLSKIDDVDVVFTKKRGTDPNDVENTIIINQKDLMDADSSFCLYNPQINDLASNSPEDMFYVMGLVVGTIGTSWVQFRNLYPIYASYVKQTNGADLPVEYIIGLDGKKVKVARWFYKSAPKYIKSLWRNRDFIYKNIFEKGLIEDEYELYKFILRYVDGMSTVKAAFAVQLLSGKLGCIDNINADIYGSPVTITNNIGLQISSPAFSKKGGEKTEDLSKKGQQIVADYIGFLKAIGKVTKSEHSKRLWDDWVQLAAAKSVFADSHKQIKFNLLDGRTVLMPTYNGTTNSPEYAEFLKNAKKTGVDPYGGFEIGKEHFTLPKMAGEIDDAKDRIR